MPFNGSGTFNPSITFVPNTSATAEDQNTQDVDFASGLTNCMTRDGQAPATANLSMGGFKLTNVGNGTNPADAVNLNQITVFFPSGLIFPFAGNTAPSGYLNCDGTAYSRTTYSTLFAAIGTIYGSGDGSTTFNVPDLRGRTPLGYGQGSGLTNRPIGSSGGEETHLLTTPEMPSHTHTDTGHTHSITDPGHSHTFPTGGTAGSGYPTLSNGQNFNPSTAVATTGIAVNTSTANLQNTGGGGAHNNMQPWLAINYIIKV